MNDLEASVFAEVLQFKGLGNKFYSVGNHEQALDQYNKALKLYDGQQGSDEQRKQKATICSNSAEAFLKLERFPEARAFADNALKYDDTNHKARFRRARALLALGGFEDLQQAAEDMKRIQTDGGRLGKAEAALLRTATGPLLKGLGSAPASKETIAMAAAAKEAVAPLLAKAGATVTVPKSASIATTPASTATATSTAADAEFTRQLEDDFDTSPAPSTTSTSSNSSEKVYFSSTPASGSHPASAKVVDRTEWMVLLVDRPALVHCWLIDVYRTLVDDDAQRPATSSAARPPARRQPHGLGGSRASRLTVLSDFLLFCKVTVTV
jgi:hypothetical protein